VRSEASKRYHALSIYTNKLSEACDCIYHVFVRNWLIERKTGSFGETSLRDICGEELEVW
jgi:hypothetical protein